MSSLRHFSEAMFGLSGRRALVTGSWQGIGLTLARGLARAGVAVVLNGRNADRVEAARQQVSEELPMAQISALVFDVTRHDDVREAIDGFERE